LSSKPPVKKSNTIITETHWLEKLGFFILLGVLLLWVAGYFFNPKTSRVKLQSAIPANGIIRIQVLNGCGIKGLSQIFAEHLRAQGFYVDIGNAQSRDYPETILLDRKGKKEEAKAIAGILGLDTTSVLLERSSSFVYPDFVLIIGRDYRKYLKK